MKLKKLLIAALVLVASNAIAQLNVTFRSQLTYPGETCANICGYVDTLGNEYALVGASTGMSIVNVTIPASPIEVLQIPNVDDLWKEIKVYGKYAYVTTEGGGGLQIVNMTSLPNTAGVVYQQYTGDGVIAGTLDAIHALHIDGHYCYLYGSNLFGGGAVVLDIIDPWNPVYVGNYQLPGSNYVHDGYVRNDTLYAGHIYEGFFSVVDFTDKSSPVELASQFTPNNFTHNTWLSTNSRVLFTTDETADSYLAAYDITDLGNITELDRIQSQNAGGNAAVHNTHIIQKAGNDYAVTSWYKDGFTIVDVGRPTNLVTVGYYDNFVGGGSGFVGNWGIYPYLPSGTIVGSNIDEGLWVFSPTYVRACYLEGVVNDSVCGVLLNNVDITVTAAGIADMTDLSGEYRTGTPTPGTYNVTFSKSGYVTKIISGVVLSPGVVNTLNVQLAPFNTTILAGTTTASASPLAGVGVEISNAGNTYTYLSDAGGLFGACNVVMATDYNVTAAKWGYNTICLTGQTIDGSNNTPNYNLTPGYYDDFTFNLGWTATGSATTGTWERGVPAGTTASGDTVNAFYDVYTDCSNKAYITGNGGGSAAFDDVDGGTAILTSPIFNLTGYTDPQVNYSRFFYNGGGAGTPNDSMSVWLNNGITSVMLEFAVETSPAGMSHWVNRSYVVSDFLTPTATMRLIVRTADTSPGHLVEAGFDAFEIVEAPAGVEELMTDATIHAYPNPFSNETTISYEMSSIDKDASMTITDVTGRIIQTFKLSQMKGSVQMNQDVASGIYFVRILNGGRSTAPLKIVKMK